jgi:PqqD family protein of HPr-rel-A system
MAIDSEKRLKDLAVSETGFVFDPYSGATFTANATGLTILDALKEGASRQTIVEELQSDYDVRDSADLGRDVDEFVGLLRRYEIVDSTFEL